MISLKHLIIGSVLLGLGLAGMAGAAVTRSYSLAGDSGGQLQIGGGLPLPVQATCNTTCTGTFFPPLLIPVKTGATVMGTVMVGAKQKLIVPKGVLSKPASFTILGQADNNPALYAVATNIRYTWPNTTATFSSAARTGTTSPLIDVGGGRTIKYSNALGRKFGGPANFALSAGTPGTPGGAGPPGDLKANAAVTLYIIGVQPTGQPPCTHPAFGGTKPTDAACVAAIANVLPTGGTLPSGLAAAGGGQPGSPFTVTTPGGTPIQVSNGGPIPGIGVVKAGAAPRGTISLFAYTPNGNTGLTNMASSSGFPWTTGMLTIKATAAGGAGESWKITGKDARTASGAGVIQMVSGSLSQRSVTGDNANRGWVRLNLVKLPGVPTMSPVGLATTAGLMLLVAGYAMRRRIFA